MELLLNFAWLMLALPAAFLFRQELRRPLSRARRTRSFLLLVGILVLLFPVVSASDDLLALQRYIEESTVNQQIVKQFASVKFTAAGSGGRVADLLWSVELSRPQNEFHSWVFVSRTVALVRTVSRVTSGTDPPCCRS